MPVRVHPELHVHSAAQGAVSGLAAVRHGNRRSTESCRSTFSSKNACFHIGKSPDSRANENLTLIIALQKTYPFG